MDFLQTRKGIVVANLTVVAALLVVTKTVAERLHFFFPNGGSSWAAFALIFLWWTVEMAIILIPLSILASWAGNRRRRHQRSPEFRIGLAIISNGTALFCAYLLSFGMGRLLEGAGNIAVTIGASAFFLIVFLAPRVANVLMPPPRELPIHDRRGPTP